MVKGIIIGIVGLGIVGIIALMYTSYNNAELDLRNQATAQQKANEARYDEVWKTIKQVANVTDKYSEDFRKIYTDIMSGRYDSDSKDNPMFKWISEQNPQLDSTMYIKLSDTISAQRSGFTRVQSRLIDIKREHDNLRTKIPSKFFVGSRPALDIVVVTSDKTAEVFSTGKDNDISMF